MMVDRGTVHENVPAEVIDSPSYYLMRAVYLLFVAHFLQEMDTSLPVAQNHYVAQYLTPRQRVKIVQLYGVFQDDMSGDLRQLHKSRQDGRW